MFKILNIQNILRDLLKITMIFSVQFRLLLQKSALLTG